MYTGYGDWKSIENIHILSFVLSEIETSFFYEYNEKKDCVYLENEDVEDVEDTSKPVNCPGDISVEEMLHWDTEDYK